MRRCADARLSVRGRRDRLEPGIAVVGAQSLGHPADQEDRRQKGHGCGRSQAGRHPPSPPTSGRLSAWRMPMKSWLDGEIARVSAKSALAEAIRYALRHWKGLVLFLDDGRVDIDSNTVERT